MRRARLIPALGIAWTLLFAAFIVWLYYAAPRTVAEVATRASVTAGTYEIDRARFDAAHELFLREQYAAARDEWTRADPAARDARTQFYIAYAFYRQGWGRVYNDDALFRQGLEAINRAIALSPDAALTVDDPELKIHSAALVTLFFASAQSFNSVLPEAGLLRWMFSFFFLWTLWQSHFSSFDAPRLIRSLAVLFGTSFVLKYVLLASLAAPDGGWLKRLAGALVEGFTFGSVNAQAFAPATGYISFFTLALYVLGLVLVTPSPEWDEPDEGDARRVVDAFRSLPGGEQALVREAIGERALLEMPGAERESEAIRDKDAAEA
ncbi:MAG: hypothetical protein LC754_15880 [Acidobacteria bacterium]|nr:hypothetical protein [Acidobacteriota bacterium]